MSQLRLVLFTSVTSVTSYLCRLKPVLVSSPYTQLGHDPIDIFTNCGDYQWAIMIDPHGNIASS